MDPTRTKHDRSEQTANAALLAIMILIASGATLQIQTPGVRSNTSSNRISVIHRAHAHTQDLLLCSEVSFETKAETDWDPRTGDLHDTTLVEGRQCADDRKRRNLPPPHRA